MQIFITGGTGFIGRHLCSALVADGHQLWLLVRPGEDAPALPDSVRLTHGDPLQPGPWWDPAGGCEAAINLAGSPVFARWSPTVKAMLRDSRLRTTRNLVAALPANSSVRLLSASGIGIFGDAGETVLDEESPPGSDFLARLAADWEQATLAAAQRGIAAATMRFGIVLGPDGGALPELARNARYFLAGPLGNGRQWLPWIHVEDVVRGCRFLLERPALDGPFNFAAPNPVRQFEFARTLAHLLGRPALAPAPSFLLRLILGEFSQVLLHSQRAVPERLQQNGFHFHFPELELALRSLVEELP